MEALKVGGKENWGKLESLYTNPQFQTQQAQNIDAALASFGSDTAQPNPTPAQPTANNNTLSEDQLTTLLANTPLNGNTDSDIILIEYSDFECSFCQRHFDNGTVKSLIDNQNIAVTLKQFPLNFHPNAQKSAEGALCVSNKLGDEAFFAYIDQVFTSKDPSRANITTVATSLGMSASDFNTCLDDNTYASQVAQEMSQAQQIFGINGTPGNVLINKTTGKFVVVSGAQPASAFETAIAQLQ